MRSIKARYFSICEKYHDAYSSYICFARAIREQKFSYGMISKWLNILVEKDDYARNERKGIVDYLYHLSNMPVEKAF
jgi:hypothetical protein